MLLSNVRMNQLSWLPPQSRMIVGGRDAMDCAKMMGNTPDMLTFIGRYVA